MQQNLMRALAATGLAIAILASASGFFRANADSGGFLTIDEPKEGDSAGAACAVSKSGTIVCRSDDRELRIIRNSVSTNGRIGIGWTMPLGSKRIAIEGEDGSYYAPIPEGDEVPPTGTPGNEEAENYFVRLTDGKILGRLKSDHDSDNPERFQAIWSQDKDATYVVVVQFGKGAIVYNGALYLLKGTELSEPTDIVEICREALEFRFKGQRKAPKEEPPFVGDVTFEEGASNVIVRLPFAFGLKEGIRSFVASIRLSERDGTLATRVLKVKPMKGLLGE